MEEEEAFYCNKKGNEVKLTVTNHAISRFIEKNRKLNIPISAKTAMMHLCRSFNNSKKIKFVNTKLKIRQKKHGADTLYFKNNLFTFVVQNGTLVTTEISKEEERSLNKNDTRTR